MGFFTVALARLVGPDGRVQAVDLQAQQLRRVARRASAAGLDGRVRLVQAGEASLGLEGPLDFVLAFWMVHEVPDQARFFGEVAAALAPGGRLLIAEPRFHVTGAEFARMLTQAQAHGLTGPRIDDQVRLSRAVLLARE